eukprot:6056933-Prorocentrum_lima.AAC.1
MVAKVVAQDLDHVNDVVIPISRYLRQGCLIEPELGLGAVEAQARTRPRGGHGVEGMLHFGEREDQVE